MHWLLDITMPASRKCASIDGRVSLQLQKKQLTLAKRLLKEAYDLVGDVWSIFHNAGDAATADRLKIHGESLRREIEFVDQQLAGQP
jgi:hypothetical protein